MNVSDYDNNLRISELPKLSALNDDDYLIIQDGTISKKVKFSTFKKFFFTEFNRIGIGTAASCDSMQFAKFAHGHDYTDFWFFPTYGPSSQNPIDYYKHPEKSDPDGNHIVHDGNFVITKYGPGYGMSATYTMPVYQPPAVSRIDSELSVYNRYKPGDIQNLAVNDFNTYLTAYRNYSLANYGGKQNIDIYDESFDGFVIPNGATMTCNTGDFQDACRLYAVGGLPTATSFTVPNLEDMFFKGDPGLPTSQVRPMSIVPGHTALPQHNHGGRCIQNGDNNSVTVPLNNITFQVRGSGTTGAQFLNCVHACGYTGNSMTPLEFNNSQSSGSSRRIPASMMPKFTRITIDGAIDGVKCETSGDGEDNVDQEPLPDCIPIQMLLYIGKK